MKTLLISASVLLLALSGLCQGSDQIKPDKSEDEKFYYQLSSDLTVTKYDLLGGEVDSSYKRIAGAGSKFNLVRTVKDKNGVITAYVIKFWNFQNLEEKKETKLATWMKKKNPLAKRKKKRK